VTEKVFDAKILEPGKLIPATGMSAMVKVAVPALSGQYWNEIRLMPIFGYGYGVKTFSACTDVSSEL
jgi:hypothetical protein